MREDGSPARIPFVRWANVFNVEQTEGIRPPAIAASQNVAKPHERAAAIVESAMLCPIHHAGFAAYYSPRDDVIRMPAHSTFHSQEYYYHSLYHEMTHAVGHSSRLNREGITQQAKFGETSAAPPPKILSDTTKIILERRVAELRTEIATASKRGYHDRAEQLHAELVEHQTKLGFTPDDPPPKPKASREEEFGEPATLSDWPSPEEVRATFNEARRSMGWPIKR